jgi:hypothetical protein
VGQTPAAARRASSTVAERRPFGTTIGSANDCVRRVHPAEAGDPADALDP